MPQSLITPEQEEEYVSFCSEAIFRINVLQKVKNGLWWDARR